MALLRARSFLRLFRKEIGGPDDRPEDADLLDRFVLQRDQDAFAELVARHGPMVLGVCRRALGDLQAAEDAFQSTFVVLARKAAALSQRELLASWLYGVACRVAARARSEAARRRARESQAPVRQPSDPLQEITARELCAVLDEELLRLPERYRMPLLLCHLEGQTRDHVAQRLGWSVRTLARRLERGRELLRERLMRRGVALSAAILTGALVGPPASAAVPAALAAAAVRIAILCQTAAAAGTTAPDVIAAAEEVIKAMSYFRLTRMIVLIVCCIALGTGVDIAAYRTASGPAPLPAQAGRLADDAPPAPTPLRVGRQGGGSLPTGAIARLGTTRWRHQQRISQVVYSVDGKVLASSSWDCTVRLRDAVTGVELQHLVVPQAVSSVAITSDGSYVAGGRMGATLHVWDRAGHEVLRTEKLENTVLAVAFSPDDKLLAAGSGDVVHVWDVPSFQHRLALATPKDGVRSLRFSPDGRYLVGGAVRATCVWETATGEERHRLPEGGGGVAVRGFLPDGKALVTSSCEKDHKVVRLWDLQTGKEAGCCAPPAGWSGALAVSRDGRLLAFGCDKGTIVLCDRATMEQVRRLGPVEAPEIEVISLAFAPDGKRLAAALSGKTIHLWDVTTGVAVPQPPGHQDEVRHVAVTPDGRSVLTGGADGAILVWDTATRGPKGSWRQEGPVNGMSLSRDGKLLATTNGDALCLWEVATGREVKRFAGHPGADNVALSPDGTALASLGSKNHALRLWDIATGKERWKVFLPTPKGMNYGDSPLVFTADGKQLVSGSADRMNSTFYFWDTATGKQVRAVAQHAAHLVLSADGKTLVTSSGEMIRLWDAATATERGSIRGGGPVALSPDGRCLAWGDGWGKVHLVGLATGKERRALLGHETGAFEGSSFASGVTSLIFSPDGRTLYSGGGDTTVMAWDVYAPPDLRQWAASPEDCWSALADGDPAAAYDAMCQLCAMPTEAVPSLRKHLAPVAAVGRDPVVRLVADLDSDEYTVRTRAAEALARQGEAAVPLLRTALTDTASPEVRRALTEVLRQLEGQTPKLLRQLRAIEVLEHIVTPQSRAVLSELAAGAAGARQTEAAQAALGRMGKPTSPVP
jgi:RNA polymerase sigma factor (sigma-70 family)